MRQEKGVRQIKKTLQAVRNNSFFHKRIEFVAQKPYFRPWRLGTVPTHARRGEAAVRFRYMPHPLESDAYHRLISQTDIGLFMYDRRRYRRRCSGILQEMLAAGKPVIVPAGCWLAEQIAEPVFRHLEQLRETLPNVGCLHAGDLVWRRAVSGEATATKTTGDIFFSDSQVAEAGFPVPPSATELAIGFRWALRAGSGTYARVRAEQRDGYGNVVQRSESILGQRKGNERVFAWMHLHPGVARIALRIENAYHGSRSAVTDFRADFFDGRRSGGFPTGSVGLIAARPAQVPELLRDMVTHYSHYRRSAELFSEVWRADHDPAQTIAILTANSSKTADAAA
jgi:hypothetical protein